MFYPIADVVLPDNDSTGIETCSFQCFNVIQLCNKYKDLHCWLIVIDLWLTMHGIRNTKFSSVCVYVCMCACMYHACMRERVSVIQRKLTNNR